MQIMIVLMVPHHLTTTNYLSRWYKYARWVQLCVKKFKISIFDQFFDFHGLKRLAIAEYDCPNGEQGKQGKLSSEVEEVRRTLQLVRWLVSWSSFFSKTALRIS